MWRGILRNKVPKQHPSTFKIQLSSFHVHKETVQLPIIDISILNELKSDLKHWSFQDKKDCQNVIHELNHAFTKYGFSYLKGHTLTSKEQENVFNSSKRLFDLPLEVKKQIPIDSNGFTRGYIGLGNESGSENIEVKEGFSYGYNWNPFNKPTNPLEGPNKWPKIKDSTKWNTQDIDILNQFYTKLVCISETICRGLSLSLHQPSTYFHSYCQGGETISILRLFHYFPYSYLPFSLKNSSVERIGSSPHTDWGFLTLILQDSNDGLQVLHDNKWKNIPHKENTVLLNGGDYLSLLTNGQYRSPIHRVCIEDNERYSTVFFYYPHYNTKFPMTISQHQIGGKELNQNEFNNLLDEKLYSKDEILKKTFGEFILSKWKQVTLS